MSYYNQIEYFDSIYNDRVKYNIDWAFDDAQKKINTTYTKLCNNEKTIHFKSLIEATKNQNRLNRRQKKVVSFAIQSRRLHNIFSRLQQLLSFAEVVLSVILVCVISNVSHQYEAMTESKVLGMLVLIIFALFKVFIEKGLLKPGIEKWGWEAYHASYIGLFQFLEDNHQLPQKPEGSKKTIQTLQPSTKHV